MKEQDSWTGLFSEGVYYYNLALCGKDNSSLPIVLEPSTPGMQPEGNTGAEVYQQAISDFTEAQSLLPEEWNDANKAGLLRVQH